MTGIARVPVFIWRCAAKELREEVAAHISKGKEDCQPCAVAKGIVDAKYTKVQEQNGYFVAKETAQIAHICDLSPLQRDGVDKQRTRMSKKETRLDILWKIGHVSSRSCKLFSISSCSPS